MKAKAIEITKESISFFIYNDDDSPYLTVDGRPAQHSIVDWFTRVSVEFTEVDIQQLIDDEMYKYVFEMEIRKGYKSSEKEKEERIPEIIGKVPPDLSMTALPEVVITTSPGRHTSPFLLEGKMVYADAMNYIIDGPIIYRGDIPLQSPFQVDIRLSNGEYEVSVIAQNKRGIDIESIRITIGEGGKGKAGEK